jgi:hypothetical protein
MTHKFKSRRLRVVAIAAAAVLGGGGSAIGFFATAGSGIGHATVGNPDPITIAAGATPSASEQLFPGGTGSVTARITNPNPFRIHINSLLLDTAQGTDGFSGPGGCDLSALHYTAQTNGTTGWDVPKRDSHGDGVLDLDLEDAVSMDTEATDACQGGPFTVYLKVGP